MNNNDSDITQLASEFIYNNFAQICTGKLFVGINGVQGSGKTTLANKISSKLKSAHNLTVLNLSLDDFYLPYCYLKEISFINKLNPLYKYRGNPGTHDTELIYDVIKALLDTKEKTISIPKFQKHLNNGLGDRDEEMCFLKNTDIQIILLEGWMVNYLHYESEITKDQLKKVVDGVRNRKIAAEINIEHLNKINNELRSYTKTWNLIDVMIYIKTKDFRNAYDWRLQQEKRTNDNKLQKDQVYDFVDRFVPAYVLYLEKMYSEKIKDKSLLIEINSAREAQCKNL